MKKVLILIFFSTIFFSTLQAAHLVGGMMTYEFISSDGTSNKYKITLKVYRDCASAGAAFDNPADISIWNSVGNYYRRNINLNLLKNTNISQQYSNECLVLPPNVCVQEGLYETIIDLPIIDHSYFVIYQRCCRNGTIANIVNPETFGSTYYIEITPEAQLVQNSAPQFKDFPPIAICAEFALTFDHGATDIDGDSLVYSFVAPNHGGGQGFNGCDAVAPSPDCPPPYTTVLFRNPYSGSNPLGGNPIIKIDPVTGQLTGTPQVIGQFVVGVQVEEYRNGVKLSSYIRDFQFNVTRCSQVINAKIKTYFDEGDNITRKLCGDDIIELKNLSSDEASIFNYNWIVKNDDVEQVYTTKDLNLNVTKNGLYKGLLILNRGLQCTDTAFFEFERYPGTYADFVAKYDTCAGTVVDFESRAYNDDNLPLQFDWTINGQPVSQFKDFKYQPNQKGVYNVSLAVSDANGCKDSMRYDVPFFPIDKRNVDIVDRNVVCHEQTARLTLDDNNIDASTIIEWDLGDGTIDTGLTVVHVYKYPGEYDVAVKVTDRFGCVSEGLFRKGVRILEKPIANFDYTPKEIRFTRPKVQIEDLSRDAIKWDYYISDLHRTEPNPLLTVPDTGQLVITQIVTHQNGCTDSVSQTIDVIPDYTLFLPTAFTPDIDGLNDEFKPKGLVPGYKKYQLMIFDRWGNQVFYSEDFDKGWSGKDKAGRLMPAGSYAVKVLFVDGRGNSKDYLGNVVLLR